MSIRMTINSHGIMMHPGSIHRNPEKHIKNGLREKSQLSTYEVYAYRQTERTEEAKAKI